MKSLWNAMADDKAKNVTQKDDDVSGEVLVAAQRLMQLNNECNNINNNNDVKSGKGKRISCEEVDQRANNKEVKEIFRRKKMKKYRSLKEIYKVTVPIENWIDPFDK